MSDTTISRRRLLGAAGATGLTALLPRGLRAELDEAPILRTIPSSGERLPAIGLGTSRTFDVGVGAAERAAVREVQRDFRLLGGRLIDTSPMYGAAERVVGDLAVELGQDDLFIATKVWTRGREAGISQMHESMRRLHRERLELMQVHNLIDWRTQLATLREWKAAGRIRYLGITHWHSGAFAELERIMRAETLDFVQLNCSIGEPEAEARLLPLAADRGIAVLVNRPFMRGRLFAQVRGKPLPAWAGDIDCRSWGQFFLKYLLGHPAVTCPIPATGKRKHLVDNMQAGFGRVPDERTRRRMADWLRAL